VLGVIAVLTNCSLIALSPSVKKYSAGYSDIQVILFFIAAEVCVIVLVVVVLVVVVAVHSNIQ